MNLARMNFFKGLFTTAEDWQKEQEYHIEKRKLHNRNFHTPGVVKGERDDFRVTVGGNQKIIVQPGYAVDAQGRDLYLDKPNEVPVPDDLNRKGQQGYIWVGYAEEQMDQRTSHLDPAQSNYAFWCEKPIVKCTADEPDNRERIELGRFTMGGKHLAHNQPIDVSHVKFAGTKSQGSITLRVASGTAVLNPTKVPHFSRDDDKFWIETFEHGKRWPPALYLANAFPTDIVNDARIQWRIESSITEEKAVQYHLFIKNFGTKPVEVRYDVHRLNADMIANESTPA